MAFSEQAAKMDEILQNEVARFCTKDNLRAIIANQVDETIKRAINDEINKFYTYGEGREAIRSAVIAKLSADAAFERG
jgi:protein-disulfide isomerase-like protein with CxxC motif